MVNWRCGGQSKNDDNPSLYSPVDHHNLADWPSLVEKIESRLLYYHVSVFHHSPPFELKVTKEPLFKYGKGRFTLDTFNQSDIEPGRIRITPWSTIVFYSAFAIQVPEGLDVEEVKRCLGNYHLLNEYLGQVDPAKAKVRFYSAAELLVSKLKAFLREHSDFVYLTEWQPWNPDEIEELGVVTVSQSDINGGVFEITPQAGKYEDVLWKYELERSLIAISNRSSCFDLTIARYQELDDLRLFLGEWNLTEPVITCNRNHADDFYIALYNLPDFDTGGLEPVLFV